MLQLVYCLLMLVPLVAIPVAVFLESRPLGMLVGLVALVLAVPVAVAAYAHFDLWRAKSHYGLSDDELDEFSRLVPALARTPRFAGLQRREMRRSTKQAAADSIRARRGVRSG